MSLVRSTWRLRQDAAAALCVFGLFLVLACMMSSNTEKCSYQFPKWFGCVLANHESLSGGLIGAGGALFAAWIAWRAVMDQIESDKELAREAQRAFVHGGPGGRTKKDGVETGIVFSGQNTGKTPAFTRKIYWGVCKQTEWSTLSDNWIGKAKEGVWEEGLPPEMKPSERYAVDFTDTPIPRDEENYICYGAIVYTTVFGDEFTTSWKHRVVREGNVLKTYALSGGYSSEWKKERRRTA
jgi:hypothetical protein